MATKDGPVTFDLDADSSGLVAAYSEAEQSMELIAKASANTTKSIKDLEKARAEEAKAAAKAAKEIERAQRRVAEEAEKAAKNAGNGWAQVAKRMQSNQLISDLEQIGSVGIMAGGSISKLSMLFTSLIRPVMMATEILGPSAPLLLGLAAIPASAALAVKGIFALADSAVAAIDTLKELGRTADGSISRELIDNTRSYQNATDELQAAIARLTITIGDDLIPEATRLTTAMSMMMDVFGETGHPILEFIGLGEKSINVIDAFADASWKAIETLSEFTHVVASLGGTKVLGSFVDGLLATVDAQIEATDAGDTLRKSLEYQRDEWERLAKIEEDHRKESAKRADAAIATVKREAEEQDKKAAAAAAAWQKEHDARVKAIEAGKQLEAKAASDAQEEWQKFYDWHRSARLDDLEDQAKAASEYIDNIAETQEEATKAWEEGEADKKAATQDGIQQILEAWSQAISDLIEMNLEAKQEKLDGIQEEKEATREQIADAQGQRKRDLEWHLEVLKFEEEEAKKAAQRAFALSQTAAVSEVIIAGAVSFVKLLAAFAPTGPLAPVLAGAVVAPVVATQLAVIAKNKPPAHSGAAMGADEFYVGDQMVRNGESAVIFNQRATERGAVDQAMAMNRDAGPMASQSVRLVLADAGRSISELAVRDAKRPGSAFGTPVRGFSDPHRRK